MSRWLAIDTTARRNAAWFAYRADATPFSFTNDRKEPVGFAIDLCKRVLTRSRAS
jgi:ABC-type amino acid transport substrate-binding protein